ncbi:MULTISPECIES: MFS transporter [unclassified Oceanispirochaeta]|uniref:CynX/NimT family MFS transporter n=1 Tax=unclassified Oceanispirochaeta TaxID=2635722 RepID=UPI000E08FC69|nr:MULTISPECIES: MFS transporter [unclassified Oceanispirochaeta]MBF9014648.1 MFS transporter [Oceanispirochaeta sp. M2]NPD70904.1 MFS transporter [Oceanispirochaeta sp. M1]RDG33738.1 MFS transporter [Oceanispirochaeta sp. M1]
MNKKMNLSILIGIIFISFNLRAPITAVGPIIDLIKKQFDLSNGSAGIITTLPLIAFALFSPLVSRISSRLGYGLTMLTGLFLILAGELIRSYTDSIGLFMGTALIGMGIAIGNVLIPSIIKLKFSKNVGIVTSVYTTSMCIFAALGAGVSVPLAIGSGFGWRHTLAIWTILTLLTVFIWLPQVKKPAGFQADQTHQKRTERSSIWKSSLAWWVTLFMGTQSLLFYCLVAWLPSIVASRGMTVEFSGMMALLFQLIGLPATLIMPIIADRFKDQRAITTSSSLIYLMGMILLLISESALSIITAVVFIGIGMGGSISLAITFISLRTPSAGKTAELSGMAQSAGYLLAAIGPFFLGFIFDRSGSWTISIQILILFLVLLIVFGWKAGRDELVKGEGLLSDHDCKGR